MPYIPNPNLENEIRKKFEKSLLQGNKILLSSAKNNAPVKSGKLKKSLKENNSNINKLEVSVETDVPYAKEIEQGTFKMPANPFMMKSLKDSKNKILEQFKGIL